MAINPCFAKAVYWLSLLCLAPLVRAQDTHALHRFDAQIEHFAEAEQRDSFLHYAQRKAQLAKQADSLALWGDTQRNIERFIFSNTREALEHDNRVFKERWREPANAEEWKPFMQLECSRGWHLLSLGQIWQSTQRYEAAKNIYERFDYPGFSANRFIYKALGSNYIVLGDNDKAIALFQKALAKGESNEDISGLYANIGIAYWNKGDYATAEENYRKGLAINDISVNKRGLLLGRLAETLLDLARPAEALRTATEALHLLRPEGPEDVRTLGFRARARRVAGQANTRMGKFAEAERLLFLGRDDDRMASSELSREVGKDYIALSNLYFRQKKWHQALFSADLALRSVLPDFRPESLGKSGISPTSNPDFSQFYEENTIFEALAAKAEVAQALGEQTGDEAWLRLALDCHELAWKAESMLRHVFQYSSSKLGLQKSARAREEAAMHVARLLFERTGQQVWVEKAFAIAERSKATLLLEALQDNLLRQRLSGSDARFGELHLLRQSLAYFDTKLLLEAADANAPQWRLEADDIRAKIAALERALRKNYPNLSGLDASQNDWLPRADDFSEGEMLVGYFVSEAWTDVFVFQAQKAPVWRRLSKRDTDWEPLVRRYLAYFDNDYAILNDPAGYGQTAHALWQTLLPPESASARLLTVLPDGLLNFVPFEALLTRFEPSASLRNAAYLIRAQEIRYAWSLAVLRQQKKWPSGAGRYLLSVAPDFENTGRGLAPLAPPDYDWQGISGWSIRKLHGQKADLQHFIASAGQYRVLHFSTHAFAGEQPRIELYDAALRLPALYALPLQADLVVLSACQTGLGREEKGEGVMSLARAFAQAGAACIVSSLWSVNDESTARLLRFFYGGIGRGERSGAALRAAKLAYLADSEVGAAAQSPYFWAGLVVVGDDRAIPQPWGWGVWLGGLVGLGGLVLLCWLAWRRRPSSKF